MIKRWHECGGQSAFRCTSPESCYKLYIRQRDRLSRTTSTKHVSDERQDGRNSKGKESPVLRLCNLAEVLETNEQHKRARSNNFRLINNHRSLANPLWGTTRYLTEHVEFVRGFPDIVSTVTVGRMSLNKWNVILIRTYKILCSGTILPDWGSLSPLRQMLGSTNIGHGRFLQHHFQFPIHSVIVL